MNEIKLLKETNIFYNILCFLISENEKLFDRSDSKLYFKTVLHVYSILHHAYVGNFARILEWELQNSLDVNLNTIHKFRVGYITGWSFLFQTVFLFLALTHDGLEWLSKHESTLGSKVRYWRDVTFKGLVVPYTCFVFGMFWSLFAIDRELVFPKVYDEVIPWWFNQCVHTNILVMVLVETLLQSRRSPTNERLELILNGTVGVSYAVVYYSVYFFAGRWLYNVFGTMSWWQICIFQCFIWLSSYIFYIVQFPINRLFHKEEEQEKIPSPNEEVVEEKNGGIEKSWSMKCRMSRVLNENECSKL